MTLTDEVEETIEATVLHPFWVVRGEELDDRPRREHLATVPDDSTTPGRWVDAGDLRAGDMLLLRNGHIVPVRGVRIRPYDGDVYNFEVDEHHCYAVGWNGALVHNNNGLEKFATTTETVASDAKTVTRVNTAQVPGGQLAPSVELQEARQKLLGQLEELGRRKSLGVDPASGRYRLAEEQAALRLEQQTGRRLIRDPSGTGDWLDAAGHSYDAVGPVPAGRFDAASFTRQIDKHLLKQGLDNVVVDTTGLAQAERAAVMSHISNLTLAQQARIIVLQ